MAGGVRVGIAFNDVTLEPTPTWTYITATENLVASYEIDRGRQFEFDRTDTGTATVTVSDLDGVLDPTNSAGPYYGLLEPLLQIQIELWNPVTSAYKSRFRGFIEDYNYGVAPSTHRNTLGDTVGVTRLEISCVDIFEILTAIEMQPDGTFGDTPPPGSVGNIFFDNATFQDRITQVLTNAGIDPDFYVVFTGNINMQESTYSASENVLQVIEDAADAEFPTVANIYVDRFGRLAAHGRLAKFDPAGTAADAGSAAWDYQEWKCGDEEAVLASVSDTAQVRRLSFNRGLSKVFNSAFCTPNGIDKYRDDPVVIVGDQLSTSAPSIAQYGIRSWSSENLLIGAPTGDPLKAINAGILTGNTALAETKLFADYIVANYATPRNRISELTFRSMDPADSRATANWKLLTECDISDSIAVTVTNPGEGGFNAEPFFIEGIHESCTPLAGDYANVTLSLDVSPQAYFSDPAGLDGV